MEKLLALNPAYRLSAEEALKHEYFKSQPLPCRPDELPKIEGEAHELTVKKDLKKLQELQQKIEDDKNHYYKARVE